jgi:sorting nexin-4
LSSDLASDYEDLAASIQGLGFLESGITDPLSRFESALLDYSIGLRDLVSFTQQERLFISFC